MPVNGGVPRRVLAGGLSVVLVGCAEPQGPVPTAGPAKGAIAQTTTAAPAAPRRVGCVEAVGALDRTAGGVVAGGGSGPPALALFEETGRTAAALQIDLPVPVVRTPAEVAAGCLLLVEIEAEPAERRVLGRERVWSEREVSRERRPNPEYEQARRELARLADQLDREDREQARDLKRLAPTGNALVDTLGLVGGLVLGGIGTFARDREFEEARARLESVPRWIEESRSEPYQVTVAETELIRRATVRLALVEPDGRRYWASVTPVVRTDRLRVAVDPHPRDRASLAGEGRLSTVADLEALAAAPPPVTLSELLPRLAALVGEPGRAGGPAEARVAWANMPVPRLAGASKPAAEEAARGPGHPARRPAPSGRPARPPASKEGLARPPARLDPSVIAVGPIAVEDGRGGRQEERGAPAGAAEANAAVVRVQGPGGEAHGFYLARDKIVTLGRVLGGSSLARIETADGFTTWGVVERERPDSELLLLHVPRPGRPLPTAGSAAAGVPGGPLPEPGMPVLVEGRVVAVSLDPLAGRLAGPAELARLLPEPEGR